MMPTKPTLNVIKIGGNIIDDPAACKAFLHAFAGVAGAKILIHGGGKIATQIAEKLHVETQLIDGRRITNLPMLDVVTMVYGGLVNKNLVAQLQAYLCHAIGLTGADAGIVKAIKRPVGAVDYGFVGDIEAVDAPQIGRFLSQGLVPVIAPLTYDATGTMLNTNADTMASAVAVAMAGDFNVNLVYCFEKKGVLNDPNDDDSVISTLDFAHFKTLKTTGAINKGMIPKLDNAFGALQNGVANVTICHAHQLEQATQQLAGTTLKYG